MVDGSTWLTLQWGNHRCQWDTKNTQLTHRHTIVDLRLYAFGGRNQESGPLETVDDSECFPALKNEWMICCNFVLANQAINTEGIYQDYLSLLGKLHQLLCFLVCFCSMDDMPKRRFDFPGNRPVLAVCNVQIPPVQLLFSLFHEVEMFNTYHGQWVPMPSMPKRRAGSAAAVLDDGRMMVIGGWPRWWIFQKSWISQQVLALNVWGILFCIDFLDAFHLHSIPICWSARYTEDGIAQGLLASCDVFNPFTGQWTEALAFHRPGFAEKDP